jgi:hypothetical protein
LPNKSLRGLIIGSEDASEVDSSSSSSKPISKDSKKAFIKAFFFFLLNEVFFFEEEEETGGDSCLIGGRKSLGVKSAGGALAGNFWVELEGSEW